MGRLIYDSSFTGEFDDRFLAHLQIVVAMKLRRGESFMFGWRDDLDAGDGRTTIWLDRTIPLVFRFAGSRPANINRAWIEELTQSAGSSAGLRVLPEPPDGEGQS